MKLLPDYIDNKTHTLQSVLATIIEDNNQLTLDIATGFFRIEAWLRLESPMNKLNSLRLLIGRDPAIRPAESDHIDLLKYYKRSLQQQLEENPFNLEYKQQIDRLIEYLQQDKIEVRLFGVLGDKNQFLHAKAYIFDECSIVGSSNFTPAGLQANSELNIVNKISAIARDLRNNWFERFWDDDSVDVDYKQKLIDTLNASKFGSKAYTPYQVFLKALYELFKEDTNINEGNITGVDLADFQKEGFKKAIRLIEKHQGCIVADAVGLGKTYIGLRVIEYYLIKERKPNKIPKVMVICPAQLRELIWRKKLDEFGLKADIISHEEISRKDFNLNRYSYYDLMVIDEGHNFRNSGTNRYNNLLKLVNSGNRNKKILMLTATPINNSVYDLYHQILILARGNESYYREYGISNLNGYFKALHQGKTEITELLFQTMVRRSRQDVIRRQEAGEEIIIGGTKIHFPKRELERFTYNFEAEYQGLYIGIANSIDQLNLSPYNIKSFKLKKVKTDEAEVKRNYALVNLQKALYLKRFESSLIAFKKTVTNQKQFQEQFYQLLTKEGKLLDSKNFRKLIFALEDEEENITVTDIIEQLEEINPKEYNLSELQQHIEQDLRVLNQILEQINTIESSANDNQHYDQKLDAFKELVIKLKGEKILVFSYYKDTAKYLHQELIKDADFLAKLNNPVIDIITGDSKSQQRQEKVNRFAPKANLSNDNPQQRLEQLQQLLQNPIDILICTDVLSEGQNLQDAGILINYDLHWNPVRMIQRAGRIDRLGTEYDTLYIYNCFPEEGLEVLLGLVRRLQERIATIDREVGLDASVLGEIVTGRSLEQLERLKKADTDAEKQAILEELEAEIELVSLDEMKLPLIEFIQQVGQELVEEIPLGIHSTKNLNIPDPNFKEGGLFLAFKSDDKHFWQLFPRINGYIVTDEDKMITDKRKIFNYLKCNQSDYPNPDDLPPVAFDSAIFRVLESAVDQILTYFKKQQTARKIKPDLKKTLTAIVHLLKKPDLDIDNQDIVKNILKVIDNIPLKSLDKEIKKIWDNLKQHKTPNILVQELNQMFIDNGYYDEIEEQENPIKIIKREDIQLVCYQWFKSE
ncbi:helicase-related protein [Cyanobacterium aponinum AL20118]|uniref:Helicase-related protein n=1 Tax=Cyanobacterium aponinum AL20115 TaxID=3090662 RepID=A0AAF1C4L1_9CHRO|nr:helicase-related protein [Cyanobacterium aponinum]WPF87386.1 helicase-related protein [Cyanobacterium aponinum AL20115]